MAISVIGIVVFIYVSLEVWKWFNTTLVERQRSFQGSRLAAGQVDTAGTRVPYTPRTLSLIGPPSPGPDGSPPALPPIPVVPPIPPVPCEAAAPYFEEAKIHFDRAQALLDQYQAEFEEVEALSEELDAINDRLDEIDARLQELQRIYGNMETYCAGGPGDDDDG